jgi:hypothetical protein
MKNLIHHFSDNSALYLAAIVVLGLLVGAMATTHGFTPITLADVWR